MINANHNRLGAPDDLRCVSAKPDSLLSGVASPFQADLIGFGLHRRSWSKATFRTRDHRPVCRFVMYLLSLRLLEEIMAASKSGFRVFTPRTAV